MNQTVEKEICLWDDVIEEKSRAQFTYDEPSLDSPDKSISLIIFLKFNHRIFYPPQCIRTQVCEVSTISTQCLRCENSVS